MVTASDTLCLHPPSTRALLVFLSNRGRRKPVALPPICSRRSHTVLPSFNLFTSWPDPIREKMLKVFFLHIVIVLYFCRFELLLEVSYNAYNEPSLWEGWEGKVVCSNSSSIQWCLLKNTLQNHTQHGIGYEDSSASSCTTAHPSVDPVTLLQIRCSVNRLVLLINFPVHLLFWPSFVSYLKKLRHLDTLPLRSHSFKIRYSSCVFQWWLSLTPQYHNG